MPASAAEALASVFDKNRRVRTTVDPRLLKSQAPWYVHNIYDMKHIAELGSLRTWHVPACPKGTKYVTLEVPGFIADEYDLGDGNGRMAWNPVMGEDLANDILNNKAGLTELSINSPNLEWWGVFASPNEVPTEQELMSAHAKLDKMQTLLLQEGDKKFMEGPSDKPGIGVNSITPMHRAAAIWKGQQRDWAKAPVTMIECPGCGDNVKPNIVKHSCGWILNEAAHQENLRRSQLQEETPKAEKSKRA